MSTLPESVCVLERMSVSVWKTVKARPEVDSGQLLKQSTNVQNQFVQSKNNKRSWQTTLVKHSAFIVQHFLKVNRRPLNRQFGLLIGQAPLGNCCSSHFNSLLNGHAMDYTQCDSSNTFFYHSAAKEFFFLILNNY